jgi:uncharacterized coiled-coil protein SlyX
MISLGRRGPVPKGNQVKAIHVECDSACQFDVKIANSRIYASSKNEDYPNGIRLRLVPEINSMISPETRQNVTRLRASQDNFQKQIGNAISWDIMALDFVDSKLQRSLRDLIIKIESRRSQNGSRRRLRAAPPVPSGTLRRGASKLSKLQRFRG